MYECCLHTLRILLIRLGFVSAEADDTLGFSPIEGQVSQLKCRGQVLPTTQKVQYRVEIEQLGYGPEPFVIARASMYADGKHIVQMEGMSLRIQGLSQEGLARLWASASPLFDTARIVEFCEGAPSKCFGPIYAAFDGSERRLARLPRDPFRFIDRVIAADVRPFVLEPGGWITCEYDVPRDAWYFAATEQPTIPFSVLLEIALQPCGFLAAYAGSALTTDSTLAFRNLDGHATLHEEVFRDVGTLTTRTRLTKVSRAGEMLLEEFDFEVWARGTRIYSGHTGFGFFLEAALAQQVGIRGASAWASSGSPVALRPAMDGWRFPGARYAMLDSVERCDPDGVSTGQKTVDPSEWFFQAHFFQDPVMPGSLGLEALLQLMHVVARERFPKYIATHRSQSTAVGRAHRWQYRGQVVPSNQKVEVQARVKHVEEGDRPLLVTDGQLLCDGKVIYAMQDFALRLVPRENE
jgi:3-hydroxymyristoyl/3-hydroxydecanoyl-(acyl carrier protein) dehydratase